MKHLRHLNKYFVKYKYQLLLGSLITILARVFSLVMPEYVQILINKVENSLNGDGGNIETLKGQLIQYIFIIIGSALISGFFTFLMRQTIINVSRHVEFDLKNEIFQHYERLCTTFYKKNRTGDLMSRISEDVNKVRMYVGPAIMYSIQTITLFICVIPLMLYTSPTLTFYTLIPLPILSVLVYYVSRNINKRTTVVQAYLSTLSTFSQESFSGIRIIKAYGMENEMETQVHKLSDEGKDKNLALSRIQSWFFPLILLLIGLSNIFVIYMGGKLYIDGEIASIGVIIKFSIYVMMLTWPVATVGWVSSIVQQAEASQKRINEFLDTKPSIKNLNPDTVTPVEGDIVFDHVSFTYEDTNIEALRDISFHIKKGETIAFIGKVGSGKTTILDLIARLYDINSGNIYIDQKSINTINLDSLRGSIGYVPQDAFLFSDSIRNNILFGRQDADETELIDVAKKADIHESIIGFKKGYDTILGERGLTLSGGQKQRISIARALLKKPKIYLFDDCLSAVDTATEETILKQLQRLSSAQTTLIVTHRISSSKNADRIFVLDQGKIIQKGSHQSLIEKEGYYRDLYNDQYFDKT